MSLPVCGYFTRSSVPGVPGISEDRLQDAVREIRAGDRRESERGHRHCFGGGHATGKESATVSR